MEKKFMERCLQLAEYGSGHVSPNPLVGAVIVNNGKIIGEGYHQQYGKAHAEVNAIASVKDKSLLRNSTLYVNLEPCSHYGKTPPCAELIIKNKIPRVVIGHSDPYPEVSGRGINMLRNAGIDVRHGFMEGACEALNKRFLTYHLKKRPYIILKWAQSSDNFLDRIRIDGTNSSPISFSNTLTRMMVHKMRSEEDAIMVGTNTAILDNPSLTTRYWAGKNPLRVVIDKDLIIPKTNHLLDQRNRTIIFTNKEINQPDYIHIDFSSNDVLKIIIEKLYELKIQSLIIEGGNTLLSTFINSGLWDEARTEISNIELKSGVPAPIIRGKIQNVKKCKQSIVYFYKNIQIP